MFGLTNLGVVHTLISLVAVAAGIVSFVRYGSISLRTSVGLVYVVTTVLTCLTAFGIFRTGAFGPAHAVGVLTLVVLAFAVVVEKGAIAGARSRPIETVSYTTTFFLHMIPAINETTYALAAERAARRGAERSAHSRPRRRRIRAVHRGRRGAGGTLEGGRAGKRAIMFWGSWTHAHT